MRLAGGSAAGAVIRRGAGLTLALAAAALAAVAVPPAASARADGLPELTCSDHTLPVRIADPGPADQTMWGRLAALQPGRGAAGHDQSQSGGARTCPCSSAAWTAPWPT